MSQCEFRKQDGEQCRSHAMRGTTLCISHNPEAVALKKAAVRAGGRNRHFRKRAKPGARPARVQNVQDLQRLLFRTLEELRNGSLEADIARSIGYLAGVTAKVVETVELERRTAQVEVTFTELTEKFAKHRL